MITITATPQGVPPENQKQLLQVESPTEGTETTIKSRIMGLLLALQMAIGGSGVAMAGEIPKDGTVSNPQGIELTQNAEQKMLGDFSKLPQQDRIAQYLVKYNSLPDKDKNTVTKYYIENPEQLPKCTFQLINLLYNIQENYKFINKFSSLIIDGKFVGDESIVDDIKSLPQSLKGVHDNLILLDPKIKNQFGDNFSEFIVVIDNTSMMLSKHIDRIKKERLTKDKQDLAKNKDELAKNKEKLAEHKELLKTLEESEILYKKFLYDFKKVEGIVN